MKTEQYTPYGKEWEKEVMKLTKPEIIGMLRKAITGTSDMKACGIETAQEAQYFVEGCVNDFEAGITTKKEHMAKMGEYTGRLMHLFLINAKKRFRENPDLINEPDTVYKP